MTIDPVQRRTLRVLASTQVVTGVGNTIAVAVGGLLAARLGGIGISGLGQSGGVVGAALLAIPVSRLMRTHGRRLGLVTAYAIGALGGLLVVLAAARHSLALFLLGMALVGGGRAAGFQAGYTAVDLAPPERRARHLSFVVWGTTVGAVTAPNLTSLADRVAGPLGLPPLTGPFAFSAIAFLAAGAAIFVWLRPDPLLLARTRAASASGGTDLVTAGRHGGVRAAYRAILASPAARLGVAAVAVAQVAMSGVMSMTPVHIGQFEHGDVLRISGIVLSIHIVGMYAFSPVVGSLADRYGRRTAILAGVGLLLAACAVAGTAGHDVTRLGIGLALLGLGWSGTTVGGATLLAEAMPASIRPSAQGLCDFVSGMGGAVASALAGLIVEVSGYPTLTLVAAVATVPLLGLALRPVVTPAVPPPADPAAVAEATAVSAVEGV